MVRQVVHSSQRRRRAAAVFVILTAAACRAEPEVVVVDPDATLALLVDALHDFHVANEFFYVDHREYTGDLEELQHEFEWLPDSVHLSGQIAPNRQGWTAVATHERVGPKAGCALGYGDSLGVETPGGIQYPYHGIILCDREFDGASERYRGVKFGT